MVRSSEANMALYYVLLRVWSHISHSVSFLRFLSVIPAVATVPVLYSLGKKLFSPLAALLASLLFSLNTFHIYYSQVGRGYSLAVFLVTLSCFFFVRNFEHPTGANGVAYVIASTAAMYGHFFAGFVLLAQLLALVLGRPSRVAMIRQMLLLTIVAVASLPLFLFAAVHRTEPIAWVQPTRGKEVYHFFTYLGGSGLKFALSVIALAIAGREWWRRARLQTRPTLPFLFLTLWFLLPLGLTLLISLWKPVFSPRFLIICLPAFVLLVAEGVAAIAPQWPRYSMAAVLVLSWVTALPAYYRQPGIEDWKGAATYLSQHVRVVDTIIINNPAYRPVLEYSFPEFDLVLPTEHLVMGPANRLSQPQSDHIWLLLCHAPPGEANDVVSFKRQFTLRTEMHFTGIDILEFVRNASPEVR
ncbi:MAG TPA: glycosyltransferase family 39 protein [Terriglobales bacterium]|nr:glycosyltransferase family 39 protein [Terriglobales bacterium]